MSPQIKPGTLCELVRITDPRCVHLNGRFVIAMRRVDRRPHRDYSAWIVNASQPLLCACCGMPFEAVAEVHLRPIADPGSVSETDAAESQQSSIEVRQ